tara:strand:+ start:8 stop:577 length:570 start_codon:yes stop_codon:yes gene_type:complete
MMTPVNSTSEVKESKSVQPSSIYPIVVSAQPLQPQLISANPNPPILTNNAILVYNLAKSVKLFSMLDAFFCLIYSAYNFYYFIPFLLCLFGYYGARNYNKSYTRIYLFYCVCNLISKIIVWSYIIYFSSTNNSNYDYDGFTLFSWISILIEMYIVRMAYKYYDALDKLRDQELNDVKELKFRVARIIYW